MKTLLRSVAYLIGGIFLLLAIGVGYFWYTAPVDTKPSTQVAINEPEKPKTVGMGDTGIIHTGIPGAITEESYDAIMQSVAAKDKEGIQQLVETSNAVFIDNNTRVRVIKPGVFKKYVRLLSGDHKGTAVWVPTEYVEAE